MSDLRQPEVGELQAKVQIFSISLDFSSKLFSCHKGVEKYQKKKCFFNKTKEKHSPIIANAIYCHAL